jgi:hypothetical protein
MKLIEYATERHTASNNNGSTITLRKSQRTAFRKLRKADCGILNAPAGWGKSLLLCALAGHDLLTDVTRKVVICVPQTIISKGFIRQQTVSLPTGHVVNWSVNQNLCEAIPEKVASLRQFLLEPAKARLPDRVVVTTHRTLSAAFLKLDSRDLSTAIRKTTFEIDESHHIQAADEESNQLGAAVSSILDAGDPTVRVFLATAFFFRGDKLPVLGDKYVSRFCRHSVPFDEYWNGLQHLETYRYEFIAYTATVWAEVENLLAHSKEPTLIYCPPKGHRLLLGKSKGEFTKRVTQLAIRHFEAELWQPGVSPSKPMILDLVDDCHRAEKVRFAMNHGDQIAAILSVGMFREGADWVQAHRVIDLVPSGSDQDRNQRFGRIIRDYPGKTSVSYYSFFPRIADATKEEQRKSLSKLFAHFHASLVLENALVPIRVPKQRDCKCREDDARGKRVDHLGEFDTQTQEGIITDCHEALNRLAAEVEGTDTPVSHEDAFREIAAVLKRWEIEQNVEPLAKQIVLIFRRRANLNLPVDDLVEAGFDKVWAVEALEGFLIYSAGFGGPTTFREIRQAVRNVFETRWFEMFEQLRQLPAPPPSFTRAQWWVNYNRDLHGKGLLSEERIHLLEQVPWWSWGESCKSRFERQYTALKALGQLPEPSEPLYVFVHAVRDRYQAGKLSKHRIELLEAIPWWTWRSRQTFDGLCCEASSLSKEPSRNTRLGQWVWRTRRRFTQDELTQEEIAKVKSISWWSWASTEEATWMTNHEVVALLSKPPHHRVHPKEYKFVQNQRTKFRSGNLSQQQIRLLEAIPWWTWETELETHWRLNYGRLAELPRSPHYRHQADEYKFMHTQKSQYRAGKLPKERETLIEGISWWEW